MALSGDAALQNLSQFIMNAQPPQESPEKPVPMDDIMQQMLQMPMFAGMNMPGMAPIPKAAVSSGSESPRNESPGSGDGTATDTPTTNNREPRTYRSEPWYECFTTTKQAEFDALIYSVYVFHRNDKKLDGYDYYECISRLQSKCRYRVRAKRVNEFWIVEEKGAHNHAMEPVGTAGSHAGLPKTLREIVDVSYREDWTNAQRQAKLEEEVKRLGLPHNPRLNRQVDNRIAYLRRVKNLNETRKIQDQMPPGMTPSGGMSMMTSQATPTSVSGSADDIIRMMMQSGQDPSQLLQMMMSSEGAGPNVGGAAEPSINEMSHLMAQLQQQQQQQQQPGAGAAAQFEHQPVEMKPFVSNSGDMSHLIAQLTQGTAPAPMEHLLNVKKEEIQDQTNQMEMDQQETAQRQVQPASTSLPLPEESNCSTPEARLTIEDQ